MMRQKPMIQSFGGEEGVPMKSKIMITLALIFILRDPCNAQWIRAFGFKAGGIQASQTWEYSGWLSGMQIYDQARTGWSIGGYVEWLNTPLISVITEVQYLQKGAKEEINISTVENPEGSGETMSLAPRLDYVSIPLLAKIRTKTSQATLYGLGGPTIDFLKSHNEQATGAVFSEIKSPELGIAMGAGLDFPIISQCTLGAEFRYRSALQYAYSNSVLTVRNTAIEFLLTVGF
ncbi:MAG: PorT family protein [Calditrichaeota bacterium]|nr:MAG: PorT family protein [Calditrichota bacterium]